MPTNLTRPDFIALAIAAPHWPGAGHIDERHLGSATPFSLQNAIRVAAMRAQDGQGVWGSSNWAGSAGRAASVFMSDYEQPSLAWLDRTLSECAPDIVFIGAMTISMPGAVAVARHIRQHSPATITVLGGKHCNETIYRDAKGAVQHLSSSPCALQAAGRIDPVFDICVSGDGEEVLAEIGEIVACLRHAPEGPNAGLDRMFGDPEAPERRQLMGARGRWTVSRALDRGIADIAAVGVPLNRNALPVPATLFGIHSNFPVFDADATAHCYSDMGRGCVFSCDFCSEAASINGKPEQMDGAAYRLARQLAAVAETGRRQGHKRTSAFVEDSILLNGSIARLHELADCLATSDRKVVFGGQMTIDMINHDDRMAALRRLADHGLTYLFCGLETGDETIAATIHKNTLARKGHGGGWMDQADKAIRRVTGAGIRLGFSVLFGLGETQRNRIALLEQLRRWQELHGAPHVVSLNWAVEHPLRNADCAHDYLDWAVPPDSDRLEMICEMFGEASERYCLPKGEMAGFAELREIRTHYLQLNNAIDTDQGHPDTGWLPAGVDTQRSLVDDRGFAFAYAGHDDQLYQQGLMLRFSEFFEGTGAGTAELIDPLEHRSLHLTVAEPERGRLAAYGRLTFHPGGSAQISQLVIEKGYRGRLFGLWHKMFLFMRQTTEEAGCELIFGNVRMQNVKLFSRAGLVPRGKPFASVKTGIMHQRMEIRI